MQVTNYMNSDNDFSTVTHNGLRVGARRAREKERSFEDNNFLFL